VGKKKGQGKGRREENADRAPASVASSSLLRRPGELRTVVLLELFLAGGAGVEEGSPGPEGGGPVAKSDKKEGRGNWSLVAGRSEGQWGKCKGGGFSVEGSKIWTVGEGGGLEATRLQLVIQFGCER